MSYLEQLLHPDNLIPTLALLALIAVVHYTEKRT